MQELSEEKPEEKFTSNCQKKNHCCSKWKKIFIVHAAVEIRVLQLEKSPNFWTGFWTAIYNESFTRYNFH